MAARAEMPSVLIVDADPGVCRVFAVKLSRDTSFLVVSATSGQTAYQAVLERPFDVLLWDLATRDTYTLLPRLRALCPDAALLPLTTDDYPLIPAEVARLNVLPPLVKPVNLDILVERVRAAVERRTPPLAQSRPEFAHAGQQVRVVTAKGVGETRVLESSQDRFVVVGSPRATLPPDFPTLPAAIVELQGEDALYRFRSRVLRPLEEPLPCWEMAMPRLIRRLQRRQHPRRVLRVPVEISDDFGAIPGDGDTLDVSQSGLALVSLRPLEAGVQVSFRLPQEAGEDVAGRGEVVYIEALEPKVEGEAASYRVALRFTELKEADRVRLQELGGRY